MQTTNEHVRARRPGQVLEGRFRLEALLGRGGFGEVWRASELLPDGSAVREVALKLLAPERAGDDWAQEAKVLASLRHRSLVTVYSAGLVRTPEATPFVAMELLEGTTLADVIATRGVVPWRRALSWARSIASALDVIHAQGIVHLDLKPANVLVSDDGMLRLVDFGIARRGPAASGTMSAVDNTGGDPLATAAFVDRLDAGRGDTVPMRDRSPGRASAPIAGTPGFMAPEVIEGREVTAAADGYALGVCLYQMLTGVLPQRTRTRPSAAAARDEIAAWRAEVRASTVAGDLVPLDARTPDVPRSIAALVARLLVLDPAKRRDADGLAAGVERAWQRPYGASEEPYFGLRAYGEQAEGYLFGRDDDAERLAGELSSRALLVLQGASGAGKSSLAVAGVVPALAKSFCEGLDDWSAAIVRPGQDVDAAVRRAQRPGTGVVLVVDQLEELITQASDDARARFLLALGRYVGEPGAPPARGVRVLCTLREDFTTRACALEPLGASLRGALRFVPPPSAASARDIVTEPARLAGVAIDDEQPIVDDVLRELRSGESRLPLASFALAEWWSSREAGRLTASAWRGIGGVAGALSRHADATLAALDPDARSAARDLCLRLVTPEGTRARVGHDALVALGPAHARALAALEAARLVAVDDAGSVAISHEALTSAWVSLSQWLDEERADRSEAATLASLASLWGRDASAAHRAELLVRGGRLARALDLARKRPDLGASLRDFLDASRRRARIELVLRNGLGAALVAAIAATAFFIRAERDQHRHDVSSTQGRLEKVEADLALRTASLAGREVELARREAEVAAAKAEARDAREGLVRVEQTSRQELAKLFAGDPIDRKIATFFALWQHAWNAHDEQSITSFYAPRVAWFGTESSRDDVAKRLGELWAKSPSSQLLVNELTPDRDETGKVQRRPDGSIRVRLSRDERIEGRSYWTISTFLLRGGDLGDFQIESATLEKTLVNGRTLGCSKLAWRGV